MMIERCSAGAGDVQKADLVMEEAVDRRFVRAVQRRSGRSTPAHHLEAKLETGECLAVRRLEVESEPAGGVEDRAGTGDAFGISQRELDRQPHVGR